MRERLLLIGEAPSRTGATGKSATGQPYALTGAVMRRICKLAGISTFAYLRLTERTNVFPTWPGSAGKGSAFPMAEARRRASRIRLKGRKVLFMGRRVARAFCLWDGEYCEWNGVIEGCGGPFKYAIVPHPSGINRWYNDKANARKAGEFLRAAFEEVRGGR